MTGAGCGAEAGVGVETGGEPVDGRVKSVESGVGSGVSGSGRPSSKFSDSYVGADSESGSGPTLVTGRFAPTPSGRMHIGNVYAMLGAWLSAHRDDAQSATVSSVSHGAWGAGGRDEGVHGVADNTGNGARGRVLLRIEDVDGPRARPDADHWIMDDLNWLGLTWDGDPVYQSQRAAIYEDALRSLASLELSSDGSLRLRGEAGNVFDQANAMDPRGLADSLSDGPESPNSSSSSVAGFLSANRSRFAESQGLSALDSLFLNALPHSDDESGSMADRQSAEAACPLIYPCFCSRADIRAASAPQEGDRFIVYPGTCRRLLACDPAEVRRRLEAGERHSWRIAVPGRGRVETEGEVVGRGLRGNGDAFAAKTAKWNARNLVSPNAGRDVSIISFEDHVYGAQRFDLAREVGDTVVCRSDGIFSYQLAVVVDDLLMGVNDIVRGRDLLRSTALQMWIRRALVASGFAAKYGVERVVNRSSETIKNSSGKVVSETQDSAVMTDVAYGEDPFADDSCDAVFAHSRNSNGFADSAPQMNVAGASESRSSFTPGYAHLPLIDDPSGTRLAKRRRSLDMGELRAAGVRPEQVIGYCAWLLGLREPGQTKPAAMSAAEALRRFSWSQVRADATDKVLPDDLLATLLRI